MAETKQSKPAQILRAIRDFNNIVDTVEQRCLAADGPVTPTLAEMREDELARLWRAVQKIHGYFAELPVAGARR